MQALTLSGYHRKQKSHIQSRELGVMFERLRVVGLGSSENYQSTVGSLFDPRVHLQSLRATRTPPLQDILAGFEGVVRPGEMLRESLSTFRTDRSSTDVFHQSSWVVLAQAVALC